MKVVAIIQARMGSTRLPGKILKTVLNKTLLEYQLERVEQAVLIDKIVVATTENSSDNVIVRLCESLDIDVYRGSENDVLSRYYETAIKFEADIVVRLTSDCPLIDPVIIDQVIQLHLNHKDTVDYTSNTLTRSFPRGLDVEVLSIRALEQAHESASSGPDREHVTAYLYGNSNKFQLANLKSIKNFASHRWTVDTDEDFELIRRIIEATSPNTSEIMMQGIVELLDENPSWLAINAHIDQKKL